MILTTDPYDPHEDRPRSSGSHLSKKELKNLAIGFVVFLIVVWPLWSLMKGNSDRALCQKNFQAMSVAMGAYLAIHDERFPPLFATDSNDAPLLDDKGRPFTWCSLLQPYMSERANFVCPAASEEEAVQGQAGTSSATLASTYGMFVPYGGYFKDTITNLDQIVLIAETSNHGAADSYNPQPFIGADGKPVTQDGFVIGFDDDNWVPSADSQSVTRLAFPGTSEGKFEKDGPRRHRSGIIVLFGDGRTGKLKSMTPDGAQLKRLGPNIVGAWTVPPDRLRR